MPLNFNVGPSEKQPVTGVSRTTAGQFHRTSLPTVATAVVLIAALYFGREVFLPLAIALLLTFALAPVVSGLRRFGIPRVAAVITSVAAAFAVLAIFSFVVVVQVGQLAENISVYQSNILSKVSALKEFGAGSGIVERIGDIVENVGREIEEEQPAEPAAEAEPDPVPVEIVSTPRPIEVLRSLIGPLISPLATAGLVIVVVIFMLLEREELRDRFIRLAGYSDLHRTTEALQDAARRVGHYLLMQLVVNTTYAIPVAIGLWWLGIPNALLWGVLALVLRFVPYIGPAIAMMLPLFLALAVAPGWSLVLWTGGLFIVMELISNNIIEPWLYGSKTGLSPLAIIVAAIFWTWLWGPVGLVLSTPLTVCLVVLGKHVPQFEFLEVLFGSEPVLEPHERLYQRLLAADPDEATDQAEEILQEKYLVDYYGSVAIPALLIGERDRMRGVLADEQRRQVAASAFTLVANLEGIAQEESDEEPADTLTGAGEEPADGKDEVEPEEDDLPDGSGKTVICAGGRGELDDAAAAMLAQVLEVQGATARMASFADLEPSRLRNLHLEADTVVVGFLNRNSRPQALHLVRRLKRANSALRVGIVFWSEPKEDVDEVALAAMARDFSADFVAEDMTGAVQGALADSPPVPLSGVKVLLRKPTHRARARTPISEPSTTPT